MQLYLQYWMRTNIYWMDGWIQPSLELYHLCGLHLSCVCRPIPTFTAKTRHPPLTLWDGSHTHLSAPGFAQRPSAAPLCLESAPYAANWDNPSTGCSFNSAGTSLFWASVCLPWHKGDPGRMEEKAVTPLCLFLYPKLLFILLHHQD